MEGHSSSPSQGWQLKSDFMTGHWRVEPELNHVIAGDKAVHLEPKVMRVLVCLADRAGDVVSKEDLFRAVWPDTFVTDDVLTRAISELRKALGDMSRPPRFIQTIPKRGYRLLAPVERQSIPQPIHSLAVLSFVNLNSDPDLEYLGDGIASCLINLLSQLPQLTIPARTTVLRFKGREGAPRDVGRELKVSAILTGTVLLRGETVVVRAELVDTESGRQLWGEQYNRAWADLLTLEEEIGCRIAEALRLRLTGEQETRLRRRPTRDGEAYRLYLKGRYLWNQRTAASLKSAIRIFEEAIARDPEFAQAYAGLADSYSVLACQIDYAVLPPRIGRVRAEAAARRALELDESLAEAHASLASVLASYHWDWPAADREYRRAIELNPRYATAHHWYAFLHAALGRKADALREIEIAHELDPFSLAINTDVAKIHYLARDFERAAEHLRWTLELEPAFLPARMLLGLTYAQQQKREEAAVLLKDALRVMADDALPVTYFGEALGSAPERKQAASNLSQIEKSRYVPACCWAAYYIHTGDRDRAFQFLDKACDERSNWLIEMCVDPIFDPLRSDPRFEVLVARVGLPAANGESRRAAQLETPALRVPVSR